MRAARNKVLLLFCFLSLAGASQSKGIKISYFNATGYHLDSLTIGTDHFGRLEDQYSTETIILDSLFVYDGYFFSPKICAKIGSVYEKGCFDEYNHSFCGVGAQWIYEALIIVDIRIKTDVGSFTLYTNPVRVIK